jgi:PAS domain S-box-containing protein
VSSEQGLSPPPAVTRLAWLPVLALTIAAVAFDLEPWGDVLINGLWLMPVTNFVFIAAAGLLVAALSARSYLVGGRSANLFLGASMAVFGSASLLSGLQSSWTSANASITIQNTAGCIAGACNLAAAVRLLLPPSPPRSRHESRVRLAAVYGAALAGEALVVWAAYREVLPPFFVEGRGPTVVRDAVLICAMGGFAVSAVLLSVIGRRSRSVFLHWYAPGLALMAIGYLAVFAIRNYASLDAWIGRSAQYLGGVYLVVAAAAGIRRSGGLRSVDLLRATERLYSTLVDFVPEGVLIASDGRCVFANRAAIRLFGASSSEDLLERPLSDLLHPAERRSIEGARWPEAAPDGQAREMRAVTLDGRPIQIEVSAIGVEHLGRPAVLAVVHDVGARKAREETRNGQNALLLGINRILTEGMTCESGEALRRSCLAVAEDVTGSALGFLAESDPEASERITASDRTEAACRMTGRPSPGKESPMGLSGSAIWSAAIEGGRGVYANEIEDRVTLPQGHLALTALLAVPLRQSGKTVGMVAVANRAGGYRDEDLRALESLAPVFVQALMRHRAERAVRDRENELRTIMDAAPALIAYVDADGRYRRVNRGYEQWFGRSADEIKGRSVREVLGEDAWRVVRPYVERALAGEQVKYESELFLPGRSRRWVQGTYCPDLDGSGHVRGFVVHIVDVGWRKEAEAALRSSEAIYRTIARNIPDGSVSVVGRDLRYLAVEGSLLPILGPARSEMEGRRIGEAHDEETARVLEERFRRALAGASDGYEAQRNGRTLWSRYVPLRDERGEVIAAMAMTLDVTERTQAERDLLAAKEEAERANRAKSEFLAHMSHEIRTPISAIVGLSEVLQPRVHDREAREFVEMIRESARSLLSIIGNILDLAYIESGKVELTTAPIRLRSLLEGLVNTYSVMARQKGLSLALETGEDVPETVEADQEFLSRVLTNLLSNALKYTSRGGVRLAVELQRPFDGGERLRFAVSDTGVAIPAAGRDRLFQSFERLHGTVTRPSYQGTGLGLTISKRLVELMGGIIGLESEEGVGSTFYFTLPLRALRAPEESVAPAPPPAAGRALSRLRKLSLLLVEDNYVNRLFLKTAFEDSGHLMTAAANGFEALEALGRGTFDAVLMDIQMPGMDGLEATRRIRRMEGPAARVPVIALTAFALKGDETRFSEAGLDGYITKPIDFERLADLIRKLCPSSRGPQ